MQFRKILLSIFAMIFICSNSFAADWVSYKGGEGLGKGKHIVIVTGDDEYRSEESMPQFGKILAKRHGFDVDVLFAINSEDDSIQPDFQTNIPGLEKLADADLMILFTRFRNLPDEQAQPIEDYVNSGKPIIALRTSTHAFNFTDAGSSYTKWSWNNKEWDGGFGRQVLGETWINHYGAHKKESTRGLIAKGMESHPIVRGCEDIWGPSDVYGIKQLTGDSKPIVMGQVLVGMNHDDAPNTDKELVPVAWIKTYTGSLGVPSRVFTTTMGHGGDFLSEGFRRLVVNAVYWGLGMDNLIPDRADVELVGDYNPSPIGFGNYVKGVKPSDHEM
ncbi:MAG: ThuA domain-containing protein [Candidatus Hinthialibacter antarcticus]|nr:ThuA domain-containing protein [Candidatus Hinthialibacter antarcticus]